MFKISFYGLKDLKTNSFTHFLHAQNDIVLQRILSDVLKEKNTILAQHPEDFSVFKFATVDLAKPEPEVSSEFRPLFPLSDFLTTEAY